MKTKLKHSIALRLLRIVFGCYLVVTIIVTITQLYYEYSTIQGGTLADVYSIASSFEEGVGSALWSFDRDALNAILVGMQKLQVVEGVKVTQKDGRLEAEIGISPQNEKDIISSDPLTTRNGDVKMIKFNDDKINRSFFEYRRLVLYTPDADEPPHEVGYIYIYSDQKIIMDEVKHSFISILASALIKTFALWIIFLYFSQKLVAKPLKLLTNVTKKIAREHSNKIDVINNLAQSKNKDEIQLLSKNFLFMQASIEAKIENLSALNELSIVLFRSRGQISIYKQVTNLIQYHMDSCWAVVFDESNKIYWNSFNFSKNNEDFERNRINFLNKDSVSDIKKANVLAYYHSASKDLNSNSDQMIFDKSFLYIPIVRSLEKKENDALWLFGRLNSNFLESNYQLTKDAKSFLQMISSLACGAMINVENHEIIREQKSTLEKRVEDRTKDLANANKELKYMAVHDSLTQLPNRILFQDRLEHAMALATQKKRIFAVCCIDLTQFKSINDTYGHDAGDRVLIEASKRFKSVIRKSDTLARMGGDEFAILLEDIKAAVDVENIIKKLSASLEESIVINDHLSVLLSANIGVAFFPEHAVNSELLYKYADIAMYEAKRSNDSYAIFDNFKNSEDKKHLEFLHDLDKGIMEDQLLLHYQPIIDINTLRPIGVEALVRWEHPERGLVPPDEFILHAERTALIEPLTQWVVKEACRQYLAWQEKGIELAISINLSRRVFSLLDLDKQLKETLDKFQLNPSSIKIEITETIAMTNPESAIEIAHKLKNIGFSLSIDDFGTGQSSLSYLTQLPVNELKIDRSFILNKSVANLFVIQTIIELAHALGLDIVAEGVEDKDTLTMLQSKGCTRAQGYYICRPNVPDVIERWLKQALGI